MLTGSPFYFNTIRNYTTAFGTLFNNISIQRFNTTGGVTSTIKVPLAYGAKEKYLVRQNQGGSIEETVDVQMSLPRISFMLNSCAYAPERKLNDLNKTYGSADATDCYRYCYERVPYDFLYEVNVMTKFMDDGLQIIEQILPWFTPKFNISINDVPELDIISDVAIILESITKSDNYDGGFETLRNIIWTLNYKLKGYIYKPISSPQGLITHVIVDTFVCDNLELTRDSSSGDSRMEVVAIPIGSDVEDYTGYSVTKNIAPLESRDNI